MMQMETTYWLIGGVHDELIRVSLMQRGDMQRGGKLSSPTASTCITAFAPFKTAPVAVDQQTNCVNHKKSAVLPSGCTLQQQVPVLLLKLPHLMEQQISGLPLQKC
jgi:hypothetical protein